MNDTIGFCSDTASFSENVIRKIKTGLASCICYFACDELDKLLNIREPTGALGKLTV